MIEELYNSICRQIEIRANLILLKQELKDDKNKRALAYLLAGDYGELVKLLSHEDPKVRKNAALILGQMECEDVIPDLWQAYEKESQLFVKASYLKSIAVYEYREYLPQIKERLQILTRETIEEGELKHIREEISTLQNMLRKYEKQGKHSFRELDREVEVILLTNREHREVTRSQLEGKTTVLLAGGVKVKTKDIKELMEIRTFQEMLFPISKVSLLSPEPEAAARELAASGLVEFLENSHKGTSPFRFRVDIRGKMPKDKKGIFIKRFSARLEEDTDRRLQNSASDYEIELRLLEKKEGGFIPLLKLYTLADRRFSYRKNMLAFSIQPFGAALIMELLKPWLTEGAQVLDPFCGVGTMLIEREKLLEANPIYGIDIYPEAIEKARENAKAAGTLINFINRDFLDFKHDYLFDEIITNMPVVSRTKDMEQITDLYERFFPKAREILKQDGIMALYTTEESILIHCLKKYDFLELQKKWVIREKEGSVLYLLKFKDRN